MSINPENLLNGKGLSFTYLSTWGPLHLSSPEHAICQDSPLKMESGGPAALTFFEAPGSIQIVMLREQGTQLSHRGLNPNPAISQGSEP